MASIKAKLSSIELYEIQSRDEYNLILNLANDILSRTERMYIWVQEELEKINRQVMRVNMAHDTISDKVDSYIASMEDARDDIDSYTDEIDYIRSHPTTITTTDDEGNESTQEVVDYAAIRVAERARDAARDTYNLYSNKLDEARIVHREASYLVNRFENIKRGIETVSRSIQNDIYEIKKFIKAIEDESEFNINSLQGVINSLQYYLSSKSIFMPDGSYYEEFASARVGNASTDKVFGSKIGDIFAKLFKKDKNIYKALDGVEYRPIELASIERTEQQIISSLSGGDETCGSCSSLAFAYAGNKAGYVVYDLRGGQSCDVFSSDSIIEQIASLEGVKSFIERGTDEMACAERLMDKIKLGKEYYMAVGQHAAIVRVNDVGQKQYLELQSPTSSKNGWHALTLMTLSNDKVFGRFGCRVDRKTEGFNCLIELDSLKDSKEFLNLLGYINTAESAQVKGEDGYER